MRLFDFRCREVSVHGRAWVSLEPITLAQWAEFIRRGGYFDPGLWRDPDARRRGMLGDGLLEEVGFRWDRRQDPVTNIDWFAADAFCRWQGGRLPWSLECEEIRGSGSRRPRWSFSRISRDMGNSDVSYAHGPAREWCGGWWNERFRGPDVRYPTGGWRRLCGGERKDVEQRMFPDQRNPEVGFRVAFDNDPTTRYREWGR